MKLRIRITPRAKRDLDEILVHIGAENPAVAVDIVSKILEKIELLREQPEIGRAGQRPGTRELVISDTRYIVGYRIGASRRDIDILRVLHGARRWPDRL